MIPLLKPIDTGPGGEEAELEERIAAAHEAAMEALRRGNEPEHIRLWAEFLTIKGRRGVGIVRRIEAEKGLL